MPGPAARIAIVPAAATPVALAQPGPTRAGGYLAVALSAIVVLSMAQLYAFTQMSVLAGTIGGLRGALVAFSAGAFMLFTLVALVRQGVLMAFAYAGASVAARRVHAPRSHWPAV